MSEKNLSSTLLAGLFAAQALAVLATIRNGRPHASLLAFAVTVDFRSILLVTDRNTRKYADISAEPRVALLIDNRTDAPCLEQSIAVTAVGTAGEITGPDRATLLGMFLEKNPQLRAFAQNPETALIRVEVERYAAVRGIADVREWKPL